MKIPPRTTRSSNLHRPTLISGIQPTGRLHIGNYLGALKNFVDLQNSGKYHCIFIIVDLHSLTARHNPKEKPKQILEVAADYLAAGLDPKKSTIILQSRVAAHTELTWILNTITPMGELERMTQYKDKAKINKNKFEVLTGIAEEEYQEIRNVGLFDYPVLMVADIILYDAQVVPVGDDQDQHLELTRTLVRKFNSRFGKTFIEPEVLYTPTPRVMSLEDPARKMSKSEPATCLFIDDTPEEIEKKLKRAVTDSDNAIIFNKERKPAISNLLGIYSGVSGISIPALEKKFKGKGYGEFKMSLAKVIADHFAPFRAKKAALLKKPAGLKKVLIAGSAAANKIASKKIEEVKKKIGLSL